MCVWGEAGWEGCSALKFQIKKKEGLYWHIAGKTSLLRIVSLKKLEDIS